MKLERMGSLISGLESVVCQEKKWMLVKKYVFFLIQTTFEEQVASMQYHYIYLLSHINI